MLTLPLLSTQPGDSGAGSEESAATAAEGTPVGSVEESIDSGWQLAAPSVGDETTAKTDDSRPAADGVRAAGAPEAEDADPGAGAEEPGSKAAEETPAGNVEKKVNRSFHIQIKYWIPRCS